MTLSKLRRILTCGHKKDSRSKPEIKPHTETANDNRDDDPYATLSEVAAPRPVEPTNEEEEARHESLDKNISEAHSHQPHLGNN
mgnify:FL=1|jgi:hypothetical protein